MPAKLEPGAEASNPFGKSGKSGGSNPFEKSNEAFVASSSTVTGGRSAATSVRDPYQKNRDYTTIIVMAVLGIAAAVGGYVFFKDADLSAPKDVADTDVFTNVSHNYAVNLPGPTWVRDKNREEQDKLDLAFVEPNLAAWVTVRSGETLTSIPTLGVLVDELRNEWQAQMVGFQELPGEDTDLAQKAAYQLVATGEIGGEHVRREGLVMFFHGIWYRLVFTAPAARFDEARPGFATARASFTVLGNRPGWRDQLGTDMATFASDEHPYQISVPIGKWKKNPDFVVDSRYADLKLVDKKYALISVAPRKTTTDLENMVDTYLKFKRRRYDGPDHVVEKHRDPRLTIDGKPAFRIRLLVTKVDGQFAVFTTFVKDAEYIYQIECEAPASEAASYEPVFTKVTNTFQTVDALPVAAKPAESKPEVRPEPTLEKAAKSDADSKPRPKTVQTSAPEPKAKADKKPVVVVAEPTPAAKRPSLDDLGSKPSEKPGTRPSLDDLGESSTKKPKGDKPAETEKPESEEPTKKRRSLDDLE